MSETPIHDRVAAYMEPLMKSSERLGGARALLMVAKWIQDEIEAKRIKPNQDTKRILDALEKIRTDILLDKANRG